MPDSAPSIPQIAAPHSGGESPANTDGLWGLVLWNGTAWFSDWFYQRLQWPPSVKHKRLEALRPNLPEGAWESLLAAIRAHFEKGLPLDAELRVQLNSGRVVWWRVTGTVERNVGGQPVYLAGRMRDVSSDPRRNATSGDPKP